MSSDMIDLSSVSILNSPDVRSWPITATLSRVELQAGDMLFTHDKQNGADSWPDIKLEGWQGPIQFCVWGFLRVGGQWFGSAALEFWRERTKSGDPVWNIPKDWFYAADRWGPLSTASVKAGDEVGFMVVAGETRNNQQVGRQERSQVVVVTVPASGVGVFDFPSTTPAPAPTPTPTPTPTPSDGETFVHVIDELIGKFDELIAELRAVRSKADDLQKTGIRVHF